MGYHILNYKKGNLTHRYAETKDELAGFDDIEHNSIIFEGSGNITPEVVSQSKEFKRFSYDWYRAGIKAENLFEDQAREQNMMVERINQDKKSFNNYTGSREEFIPLKRGDFIIRDHGNIEIDVKCRSFHNFENNNEKYFRFNVEHMLRHLNMAALLHSPVLVAVFERDISLKNPVPDNIYFMDMKKMYEHRNEFFKDIQEYEHGKEYFYNIPLSMTHKGFGYIKELSKKLMEGEYDYQTETISQDRIDRICLSKHNTKWTDEDRQKLNSMHNNGLSPKEIGDKLDRTTAAVKYQLEDHE